MNCIKKKRPTKELLYNKNEKTLISTWKHNLDYEVKPNFLHQKHKFYDSFILLFYEKPCFVFPIASETKLWPNLKIDQLLTHLLSLKETAKSLKIKKKRIKNKNHKNVNFLVVFSFRVHKLGQGFDCSIEILKLFFLDFLFERSICKIVRW